MTDTYYEFMDGFTHEKFSGQLQRLGIDNFSDYYSEMVSGMVTSLDLSNFQNSRLVQQSLGQYQWWRIGRPYCKIGPQMTEMLARTKINIDSQHVHMTFPAFEIRFSQTHPFRESPEHPPLRALLVLHGFLPKPDPQNPYRIIPSLESRKYLMVLCDFGERFQVKGSWAKFYHYVKINLIAGETIESQFKQADEHHHDMECGYTPSANFQKKIMAILVSTLFFVDNKHELVTPDIPRRYIER